MGLLRPIKTTWYDAIELEIIAGTARFTLFEVCTIEDGRAIRVPVHRIMTTVEVAQMTNRMSWSKLAQPGRPSTGLIEAYMH